MSLLGLKDTSDGLSRANGVRWYGHFWEGIMVMFWEERWILKWRKEEGVGDQIWRGKSTDQIGLKKENAIDRTKWRDDPATCVNADEIAFKKVDISKEGERTSNLSNFQFLIMWLSVVENAI